MDEIHEVREAVVDDPGGVTYHVRAVKRGVRFRKRENVGPMQTDSPADLIGAFVADIVVPVMSARRARRRSTWKIAALRDGGLLGQSIVHKEVLADGVDPAQRILELTQMIRAGEFRETR